MPGKCSRKLCRPMGMFLSKARRGIAFEQRPIDRCSDGDRCRVVDRDFQLPQFDGKNEHQYAQHALAAAIRREAGKLYVFVPRADVLDAPRMLCIAKTSDKLFGYAAWARLVRFRFRHQ